MPDRTTLSVAWGAAIIIAARLACADEPRPEPDPVLQDSIARVSAITVDLLEGDGVRTIERVADPVLRFEEPTRANEKGSVWVWGATGRPAATLELFYGANLGWTFAVNSLAAGPLRAQRNGVPWWQPEKTDLSFSALPDAPPPAATDRARLLQLRALARRFSAHEFWDPNNSRFDLRLLPQPVHRYADEKSGLLDGALFVFANGTNPEVFLLLEAVQEKDRTFWQYGAARTGHAEMHLWFDGNELWTAPRAGVLSRNDAYWLDFERVTPQHRGTAVTCCGGDGIYPPTSATSSSQAGMRGSRAPKISTSCARTQFRSNWLP
jgi:hypothetical protein